jgi:hypothetical protein
MLSVANKHIMLSVSTVVRCIVKRKKVTAQISKNLEPSKFFCIMENVRQVVVPIVAKCIRENIFIFMYLFYPTSPLKLFPRKWQSFPAYPKNWSLGFFPTVSFMTDAKILLSTMLPHSNTLFLCLARCLPVSPSFRSSINIT